MNDHRVVFIIAHKYYRTFQSFIKYYVDNIQKFYGDRAYIIIVDNQSKYIQDIIDIFQNYERVTILLNTLPCKFEQGAYNVGINFILENNLFHLFDYYVFTQDTFILKNKFDFHLLEEKNTVACSINLYKMPVIDYLEQPYVMDYLEKLEMVDSIGNFDICFCNSFVLHKSMIHRFLLLTKDFVITEKKQQEATERYLGAILFHLNNEVMESIDGYANDYNVLGYHPHKWNPMERETYRNFMKHTQFKGEHTMDS
jgi:hypothetical protein